MPALKACLAVRGLNGAIGGAMHHPPLGTALRPVHQPVHAARKPGVVARAQKDGGEDMSAAAARLNQLIATPSITGTEIRQMVFNKWGRSYDVRLMRKGKRMYVEVMWKYLEQQSFPLTEAEYLEQLDAVAYFLNQWGAADTVRQGIAQGRSRGPGYTGGTSARCISIPLDVDLSGARGSEWN